LEALPEAVNLNDNFPWCFLLSVCAAGAFLGIFLAVHPGRFHIALGTALLGFFATGIWYF
jgi:hypothetical protein